MRNLQNPELYQRIYSEEHKAEFSLSIGESGVLIDENGNQIFFGGESDVETYDSSKADKMLVDIGDPETGYREWDIRDMKTYHRMFDGNEPTVGNVIAGEIDVVMNNIVAEFPKASRLAPFVRLTTPDGSEKSEWIPKGVYHIDTRESSEDEDGLSVLSIHGYDALAKANGEYPSTIEIGYEDESEKELDTDIVRTIAGELGVDVDSRTWEIMTRGYRYGIPLGYSMQEVLSFIAASYVGNFIITDDGLLRLVTLTGLPKETRYLIDEVGFVLVFGDEEYGEDVRILV